MRKPHLAIELPDTAGDDKNAMAGAVALLVGTQRFYISEASPP
jgi:hypothetical protein